MEDVVCLIAGAQSTSCCPEYHVKHAIPASISVWGRQLCTSTQTLGEKKSGPMRNLACLLRIQNNTPPGTSSDLNTKIKCL